MGRSPSETPSPSTESKARAKTNPTIVAMATPAMNETESLTALEVVRKMIADMICGPAIIVMARGRMARCMDP